MKNIEAYEYMAENIRISVFDGAVRIDSLAELPIEHEFHAHELYEMFIVKKGEIICHFEDEDVQIGEKEILIIRPKVMHHITNTKNSEVFCVNFFVEYVKKTKATFEPLLSFEKFLTLFADFECLQLADFLEDAMRNDKKLLTGTYFFALLLKEAEIYDRKATDVMNYDSDVGRIYIIEQILSKYYKAGINMEVLAENLHISKRQLSRIIKKQYGCTYREMIIKFKMMDAVNMLTNGESVSETARMCGYSSIPSFYNAFKKIYGVSPGEYGKSRKTD